jgi:hypothetical protein
MAKKKPKVIVRQVKYVDCGPVEKEFTQWHYIRCVIEDFEVAPPITYQSKNAPARATKTQGKEVMWMVNFSGGGGVWESNPPTGGLTRSTGFEVLS